MFQLGIGINSYIIESSLSGRTEYIFLDLIFPDGKILLGAPSVDDSDLLSVHLG